MGWKSVKEHYRIEHIVQVTPKGIAIGSGYVQDLLLVHADGSVEQPHDRLSTEALQLVYAHMKADPEKLRQLVAAPDSFERSIPVYTYEGSQVLEKFCETPGWPNLTHDGALMYENMFFLDKAMAVVAAKRNATLGAKVYRAQRDRMTAELLDLNARIAAEDEALRALEATYPTPV